MNRYKKISFVYAFIAIILSNVMSANVAYEYCNNLWAIKYLGYSAPAAVAFLLAIPYMVVIIICIIISYVTWKKSRQA